MEKGGGRIESTTLFGKYQLLRILGQGAGGTVYLAEHRELEELRAIKQVPKSSAGYQQFRKEALILKEIRHPGIPIVYDLEEDEQYSYLIEEFLEGDSLYALISDMGHFSQAMTIRYGIQICRLVYSLHIAKPYPILHLDLQPKNLLLCKDTIKLIDFDHAVRGEEAKQLKTRYGTVGFAAPEQYLDAPLDERTDIYGIGALLYYMAAGTYPAQTPVYPKRRMDRPFQKVLRTCLAADPAMRYGSADQLCDALEQLLGKEKGVFSKDQSSSLTIAAAGVTAGVGVTHAAVGLAAFLRDQGFSVLYEEKNESGAVRQLAVCAGARADRSGVYRILGLPMLPRYGEAVCLQPYSCQICVQDYGTDWSALIQCSADGKLLLCGGKPWQWETAGKALSGFGIQEGQAVIYNHFCRQLRVRLPGPAQELQVFLMPYHANPFQISGSCRTFYRALAEYLLGEPSGGLFQWLKRKRKRRIGTGKNRDGEPWELSVQGAARESRIWRSGRPII